MSKEVNMSKSVKVALASLMLASSSNVIAANVDNCSFVVIGPKKYTAYTILNFANPAFDVAIFDEYNTNAKSMIKTVLTHEEAERAISRAIERRSPERESALSCEKRIVIEKIAYENIATKPNLRVLYRVADSGKREKPQKFVIDSPIRSRNDDLDPKKSIAPEAILDSFVENVYRLKKDL
jgi:hypothetical protein